MHAVSVFQTSSTKSPPTDGDIRLLFAEVDFGYGDLTAVYGRDSKKLAVSPTATISWSITGTSTTACTRFTRKVKKTFE